METKWLEDFVSLAETRSFSRSAQLRHVTQPAFSRRIQALEAWAGVDLVDRSSYPTRLTGAGETLLAQAVEILGSLQATRNMLRSHQSAGQDMIEFAVPHSLAFSFFPHWLMDLRQRFGSLKSRLNALNVHDAMLQLSEGNCDLLIVYHHASQPLQLDPERYQMASLGHETLAAYAKADAEGQPLFRLPGHPGQKIPFLSYASGAYLGRLVELIAKNSTQPLNLDAIYETDMAEGPAQPHLGGGGCWHGCGAAAGRRPVVEGAAHGGRACRPAGGRSGAAACRPPAAAQLCPASGRDVAGRSQHRHGA